VTWTVKANENSAAPPTITPDGPRTAKLKANQPGSFSVVATLDSIKIVWNVVFVWVKVDTNGSKITPRQDFRNASPSGAAVVSTGEFRVGKYAWEADIKAQVIGGGTSQTLGVGKVKVEVLQNCFADSVTGNYEGGGTALETPKGGIPGLDSNSTKSPFTRDFRAIQFTPLRFEITDASKERELLVGDSPGAGFPTIHQNSKKRLLSMSGSIEFRTAIASVGDDAPNTIVVHGQAKWIVDFSGTVDFEGIYHPTTPKLTADPTLTLISDTTGGREANAAGFETMGPLFAGKPEFIWNP
jgi:hypothetical protein